MICCTKFITENFPATFRKALAFRCFHSLQHTKEAKVSKPLLSFFAEPAALPAPPGLQVIRELGEPDVHLKALGTFKPHLSSIDTTSENVCHRVLLLQASKARGGLLLQSMANPTI